jgi:VIT1/CCC1 family predicted Fe2+/Mn2+ transporter
VPRGSPSTNRETHLSSRSPWLRAAVLGANDGLVSTASLMLGVAASDPPASAVVTAGVAGLVAGALSMAVGEYVSVSAQRDSEQADLRTEQRELEEFPEAELRELREIYVRRGLDRDLAQQVAVQLHEHDALEAHLRDELQLDVDDLANPTQAAVTSAVSFGIGAFIPVLIALLTHGTVRIVTLGVGAMIGLGLIGWIGARLGGGISGRAAVRVLIGGGLAMGVTALIGHFLGTVV